MSERLKLKICGMKYPDNIREVAVLQPEYLGFIFYNRSPRFVGEDFVLPDDVSAQIIRVGVFVNATEEYILLKATHYGLSYIQLHGTESPAFCKRLKDRKLNVIKVFSVGDSFDFSLLEPYLSVVDYFLFDTKGVHHGGNGVAFDWKILADYPYEVLYFLSGGLNPDNISELMGLSVKGLYGIDVNSGVEAHPGMKDTDKINNVKRLLRFSNNDQPSTI